MTQKISCKECDSTFTIKLIDAPDVDQEVLFCPYCAVPIITVDDKEEDEWGESDVYDEDE
jgi:uncharacterized protein YbaR (Trm112 family)